MFAIIITDLIFFFFTDLILNIVNSVLTTTVRGRSGVENSESMG